MALRFYTGFDYFDTTQVGRVWPYHQNGTSLAPGRFDGRGWCWQNQGGYLATMIPSASTVIVGMAFQFSGGDPTNPFLVFQDATTSQTNPLTQVDVRVTSDRAFQVTRNGQVLATSLPYVFDFGFWNYMEVKVHISDSLGYVQIKVNGQVFLNSTSLDTQYTGNNYVNMVRVQSFASSGYTFKLDDMYIIDDASGINNDFLGECRVKTTYPAANGERINFQAIGETQNFNCVNEPVMDDDATYVRSGTTGDIDDYTMDTVDLTGAIYGIQVNVTHRKDDVGQRIITPIIKSQGHYFEGDQFTCFSDYRTAQKIWEVEPQNIASWTNTTINALNVGLKIKG